MASRSSLFDIEGEGAPSDGVDHSSTCMLVEGVSISSDKLADCELEGNNECHTRSNIESQCMEESAAQTARSTSDGWSKAVPTAEDKATLWKLATNIGKAKEGGPKQRQTWRIKQPYGS
eukprot:14303185-Ditylum_brightwellii.AAC.1